ncbi:hypothetical protein MMC14_001759 [Varicellaria rhodocarpa]|nr:hypothetical protein [Varicellaria rhodocarpa]
MSKKTIVVVNSTGRQGASITRVASAVGYHVRAQMHTTDGLVAQELSDLPNVSIIEGSLEDADVVQELFKGAHMAFINTTAWGDEVVVGRRLADAAKRSGVQHYIYSSMPDHGAFGKGWPSLPHWSSKFTIENYIKQIGLPATFVYMGIYNNNFTSLPYPLFCMELQADGSFLWRAPFHPDTPLPWLDAEHDVGPTVLQIFKDGLRKWSGKRYAAKAPSLIESTNAEITLRIALAFEVLSPREVCARFESGIGRPVQYAQGPIEIKVSIPTGYREQLSGLQILFGKYDAPYFGPDLEAPDEALQLWEGFRGIEEYAREVFPTEEAANGMTWMS